MRPKIEIMCLNQRLVTSRILTSTSFRNVTSNVLNIIYFKQIYDIFPIRFIKVFFKVHVEFNFMYYYSYYIQWAITPLLQLSTCDVICYYISKNC